MAKYVCRRFKTKKQQGVSGVNVFMTILMVFVLAGVMYGITGFIEGARIASCSANTGLNYECDAIAACVIGGVSFVGGTGKISGIVIGVLLLQIILPVLTSFPYPQICFTLSKV